MDMIAVLDGIGIDPSASGGANYSGGSSWASGFPTYPSSEGLAGYMDAFDGLSGFQADAVNPSASGGANYSGGSSWAPGFPTYPSSEGLAMAPQGYDVSRVNPSASGGANYSGGSSWAPGFPTYPSTNGLASIRLRGAIHGLASGGMEPRRAAVAAKAALMTGQLTQTSVGNAAYEAAFLAARMAGYDPQFARAAGNRAAGRAIAEGWGTFATKA
jgi:hypothetical protein